MSEIISSAEASQVNRDKLVGVSKFPSWEDPLAVHGFIGCGPKAGCEWNMKCISRMNVCIDTDMMQVKAEKYGHWSISFAPYILPY